MRLEDYGLVYEVREGISIDSKCIQTAYKYSDLNSSLLDKYNYNLVNIYYNNVNWIKIHLFNDKIVVAPGYSLRGRSITNAIPDNYQDIFFDFIKDDVDKMFLRIKDYFYKKIVEAERVREAVKCN